MNYNPLSKAKDAILHFLQTAFSNPKLFSDGQNPYLYSEDEKSSRIMIADSNTENLNSINVKPAILVQRAQTFPKQLGLGDKSAQNFGSFEERSLLFNVGMSVNCYAREGLEAENLAVFVFMMLRYMNESIQKNYGVFDLNAQGIGTEQIITRSSSTELVMVPVMTTISVPNMVRINFNEIQLNALHSSMGEFKSPSVDSQGKTI